MCCAAHDLDSRVQGEPDPPRREVVIYDFYVENPPTYYLEISLPNLPPSIGRTQKLPWALTPRAEDAGEDDPVMDFQFDKIVSLEASKATFSWLRFAGVQVELFQEKLAPPPEPEPPKEEGEGEEGEAEGEAEEETATAEEGDGAEGEEPKEIPPEVIVTPLARCVWLGGECARRLRGVSLACTHARTRACKDAQQTRRALLPA